jgi:hypothetical protein
MIWHMISATFEVGLASYIPFMSKIIWRWTLVKL